MAKRVHKNGDAPKKPNRKGVPYHFWLDDPLSEAFEAFLKSLKPKPTITAAMELFIEECLQRRGFLPPTS